MAMVMRFICFILLVGLCSTASLAGEKDTPFGTILFVDGKYVARPFTFAVEENELLVNNVRVASVAGVYDPKDWMPKELPEIPKELLKEDAGFESASFSSYVLKLRFYFFNRGESFEKAKKRFVEQLEKIPFIVKAVSESSTGRQVVLYDKDHSKPHDGLGGVNISAGSPRKLRTEKDVAREIEIVKDVFIRDLRRRQVLFLPKDEMFGKCLAIPQGALQKYGSELIRVLGSDAKPDVKIGFLSQLPSFSGVYSKHWASNDPQKRERVRKSYLHIINVVIPGNFVNLLKEMDKADPRQPDDGALLRKRIYDKLFKGLKKTPHTSDKGLKLISFLQGKKTFPYQPVQIFAILINTTRQPVRFRLPWSNSSRSSPYPCNVFVKPNGKNGIETSFPVANMHYNVPMMLREYRKDHYSTSAFSYQGGDFGTLPPKSFFGFSGFVYGDLQKLTPFAVSQGQYKIRLAYAIDDNRVIKSREMELEVKVPNANSDILMVSKLKKSYQLRNALWGGFDLFSFFTSNMTRLGEGHARKQEQVAKELFEVAKRDDDWGRYARAFLYQSDPKKFRMYFESTSIYQKTKAQIVKDYHDLQTDYWVAKWAGLDHDLYTDHGSL